MFDFDNFINDYFRGYSDDQLERARFVTLAEILLKKKINYRRRV